MIFARKEAKSGFRKYMVCLLFGLRYSADKILGAISATMTFREFILVSKLLN